MDVNFIIPKLNAFGDYIFLIILAVASIIQAVVQKNKKEEAEKAQRRRKVERELEDQDETRGYQSEKEEEGSVFDKVEEMWLSDKPKEEPGPAVQETVRSKIAEKEKQFDIQNYKMFGGENDESPQIQRETKIVSTKAEIKQRLSKTFNLRKAIIYSEVLNRKYF